jgi:hypothetical protein
MKRFALLCLLVCAAPIPATAAPPPVDDLVLAQAGPDVAAPVASDAKLSVADVKQLLELARGPAAAAPQAQVAAPASSAPAFSFGTLLGLVPLEVWGFLAGIAFLLLFQFWRGPTADMARDTVLKLAEGAWYIAEKDGGTSAQKYKAALDAFAKAATGAGFSKVPENAATLRDYAFEAMSAADKVARKRAGEGLQLVTSTPEKKPDPSPALAAS